MVLFYAGIVELVCFLAKIAVARPVQLVASAIKTDRLSALRVQMEDMQVEEVQCVGIVCNVQKDNLHPRADRMAPTRVSACHVLLENIPNQQLLRGFSVTAALRVNAMSMLLTAHQLLVRKGLADNAPSYLLYGRNLAVLRNACHVL